jgi:aryl carrier-like protein
MIARQLDQFFFGVSVHMTAKELSVIGNAFAELWCDVLGVATVNPNDDFVESGGTSLKVIKLIATGKSRGLSINAGMFCRHLTFAQLLGAVEAAAAGEPATHGVRF